MIRGLIAFLALFCLIGVAHAGDKPLYLAAPEWVTAAPDIDMKAQGDAEPMVVRLDQQHRLEGDQVWTYVDTVLRLSSPEMLIQAGTIQFPWEPSKGDLIIHSVEILRGSERIDLLKAGQKFNVIQREQMLEQAQMNGMLTATMAVEGLRVGDMLRVAISITRRDPTLGGKVQAIAPLVLAPAPIKYGRLRMIWPAAMRVGWKSQYLPDTFDVVDRGAFKEMSVLLPLPEMPDFPSDAPLRFRPLPLFEATTFSSWDEVSRLMAPLYRTEGAIAPGSPLAGEVARIAAATTDPRARAAMALQLVQDQVRYLYRGMDTGNYVPQSPMQTWALRYGDCKAKTLLLLAILQGLGIEAEPALVNSALGDALPNRLPMPGAFDHVIVRAVIGGKTLWLDGTVLGTRLADLDDAPIFRNALPLRTAGAALVAIPLHANARPDASVDIELDGRAGVGFPMPFTIRAELRGTGAMMLRMASQLGKEKADEMADAIVGQYLEGVQVGAREIRYDEPSGVTVMTASGLASPDWAKEEGRQRLALDTAVGTISFDPDRSSVEWKNIPVATGDPSGKRIRTRIRLPGRGAGFALEGDQTLPASMAGATLARSARIEGEWLTVEDRATTGLQEVAPADIPAVRAQVTAARARLLKLVAPENTPPLWQQVAPARAAKLLDPILAVYAKRIAEKPKEVSAYSARAQFLESIYDRQGALRDLDKAIATAPTATFHLWRARLREAMGDDAKALEDAKAARALDPGSAEAISQFATLRAHNGGADEAIALVSDRVAEGGKDKNSYVMLQAGLMADAGKGAQAIAVLDAALKTNPGNPTLLNSRCWIKGTTGTALDTALKDCTKAIELSDSSAHILDSRGLVYFKLGRLEDALADFEAALDQAPGLPASLYMRGVIRRRMGATGGDADLAAARMMAPRIDEDYARYGIKP